jgi:N-acyl-D-aspartate/D-glutamate deacylase
MPVRSARCAPQRDHAAERDQLPFDALLDLALDDPDLVLRFACTITNDDDEELAALLRNPHLVLGLPDAGAHVGQIGDAVQATDFLDNWARGRRLSGAQADLLGFPDRGRLAAGPLG